MRDAARAFLKAMAGETRQQILALFAGGVAERLPPAQSATSTHLATLRDGGVLASRREWKTVYYRADAGRIGRALSDLQASLRACRPPVDCSPDSPCG
ncbi:transcriptional regulator [Streptosporangium sp. NPDC005286]|uniref:ArsR/SmtB family transcription factor n=1 Tax=Streptosporangium sp. NPDC005286 TaxID=3154463 RepID=UPI0033B8D890